MALASDLKSLVDELDRIHGGAAPWAEEAGIPEFVTAENGAQRYFNKKSRDALWQVSGTLHQNRLPSALNIEIEEFAKIVRQAVADMHAAEEFAGFDESDSGNVVSRLKFLIEDRIAKVASEYTHYFPAWTLGMERDTPFVLGPVTFLTRSDWIDSVDFPQHGKERYLNQPEINFRWKDILKEAIQKPKDSTPIDGLAAAVYNAISECPSLVKVTVLGYERNLSRKLARLAAKTALDAISLGLGAPECFQQQALQEERLPPIGTNSLIETNGLLWMPGSSLGKRFPSLSPARVRQALSDLASILPAFGEILVGVVNPSSHKHPKLANRWATALDWFGEGNRESSDAIALAKLGTSLDVLCNGGKAAGIANMVSHLTGAAKSAQVIGGRQPRTLEELVADIYNAGRSKILHGTHYDRLESFAVERQRAAYLARIALIECAVRLQRYTEADDDKAFRNI